jgi:hypothetical protein
MKPFQYANMINSLLYIKDYELIHQLSKLGIKNVYMKGGEYKEIEYDNEKYKINILKSKTDTETNIVLLTLDDLYQCGLMFIYKKEKMAYINDIHYYQNCYEGKIKNGKILMKLMIHIAKKYGVKNIELSDRSLKLCVNNYKFHLKYLYTLLYGFPWYYQFGFMPIDKEYIDILKYNYNIIMKLKVKDIDDILKEYNINVKNKETYARYVFRNMIEKDCKFFYDIYENIYNKIGLKIYKKNFSDPIHMVLKL